MELYYDKEEGPAVCSTKRVMKKLEWLSRVIKLQNYSCH